MTAIRRSARGQECQLRIPGVCNGNPETVVWCHINDGTHGTGKKSRDLSGCYGCSACHDVLDGRNRKVSRESIGWWVLAAVLRSQAILQDMQIVSVKGETR